ncbi:MAG: hypothetical protein M3680_31375 [Myxococcota bacterium]|nr:hypothetical protein [Myxococcota bacterium]
MRRFELAGEPRRYWEVTVAQGAVAFRWGVVGALVVQQHARTFGHDATASAHADEQIAKQLARGYVEVTPARSEVIQAELRELQHQRYEWAAPASRERWFVELRQEGHTVTRSGGRAIAGGDVPDGDLQIWHFDRSTAARAAYEERCAEVEARGGVAVEEALVRYEPQHYPELEARCEESPHDPGPWLVYADWLMAHGDVRGEIAALELAGKHREAMDRLGEHLRELCGSADASFAFELRHGFAIGCTIKVDADGGEPLEDVTRTFLASPMGRFIEALRFGLAGFSNDNDWAPTLHAVTESARAPHLRALRFDAYTYSDSELSWTPYGDFSGAWAKLPALEHLHIRSGAGGTLGELDLPRLRTFIRESGGLARAELDAIVAARWPALEHLEIWSGSSAYGAEGDVGVLRPILAGEGLPRLRHLGIVNCEFVDSVIPELARSPVLRQLHSVDLSNGVMARLATEALVASAPAFRHLALLELGGNLLLDDELAQIRAVLDNVVPGKQREREYDDADEEELDRYVAVGE